MRPLAVSLICGLLLGWGIDSRSARGQDAPRHRAGHTAQVTQLAGVSHHVHHHGGGAGGWYAGSLSIPGLLYWPVGTPLYPVTSVFGYTFTLPMTPPVSNVALPVARLNPPAPKPPADVPAAPRKPNATNAEQKARAGRFIGFGDSQFEKQNYLAAIGRYKTAMSTAPDLAEAYFRQAFARVALGQYEAAASAFRRGLALRSNWRGTPFRLEDLYGKAPLPKNAHIEKLAMAVEDNPFDADLLFVLGLQLFFDGQADRAGVFLTRAAQLGETRTGT